MDRLPSLIETERLVLRRWDIGDVDKLHDAVVANVEHLRPWMPWIAGEPLKKTDRKDLLTTWTNDWKAGGDCILGAFLEGGVVGATGLHRRGERHQLEIGYWVHKDHVGNGLATEMATALTTAALALPGIRSVEIHHDKANRKSEAVPRKLDYELSSQLPAPVKAPGEVGTELIWKMTERRWSAANRNA